jgi:hypothetical protein
MHHKCGGLASVFIILVCLGILAYKLFELVGRGTIYYSSNTTVDLFPTFTTISTFANETEFQPYMLAVSYVGTTDCPVAPVPVAFYGKDEQQLDTVSPISLEPCTPEHFASAT